MGSGYHTPEWLAAPAAPRCQRWFILAGRREAGLFAHRWRHPDRDLTTGEDLPLPGTALGDFNPVWSPDGAQIVFNRGMGIFDLFIVNLDGSNLRQITHGGVQEWPVGWLPDGGFLYTVPGREYEYIVYRLDLASGESQVFSNENIQSLSPDGQYVAIANLTFGERWAVDISRLDGADRWALANDGLWVLNPLWSPDGSGCWRLSRPPTRVLPPAR